MQVFFPSTVLTSPKASFCSSNRHPPMASTRSVSLHASPVWTPQRMLTSCTGLGGWWKLHPKQTKSNPKWTLVNSCCKLELEKHDLTLELLLLLVQRFSIQKSLSSLQSVSLSYHNHHYVYVSLCNSNSSTLGRYPLFLPKHAAFCFEFPLFFHTCGKDRCFDQALMRSNALAVTSHRKRCQN